GAQRPRLLPSALYAIPDRRHGPGAPARPGRRDPLSPFSGRRRLLLRSNRARADKYLVKQLAPLMERFSGVDREALARDGKVLCGRLVDKIVVSQSTRDCGLEPVAVGGSDRQPNQFVFIQI